MNGERYTYKTVDGLDIQCQVWLPENAEKPVPVVLYYHGGALTGGDMNLYNPYQREALLKEGYAFLSADYRLGPVTKLPQIMEDIQDAFDWVLDSASKEFGLDPQRVAIMGSSAGGYISLMTGTFPRKPKAIVSFYGYGDILGDWYCKPDPFYCTQPPVSEEDAIANVGGNHARTSWDCSQYYLRCRQQGTWTSEISGMDIVTHRAEIEKYCPEFQADKDFPPTFLLHGDADTDVPYQQSVQMNDVLKKLGVEVQFYTEPGGHGFDGSWAETPEKFNMVLDFIKKHV